MVSYSPHRIKPMLDETKRKAIVDSFRLVVPIAETAADLFYQRLFELRPAYRKLFKPDLGRQKNKLVTMLAFIVKSLDYRDTQWADKVDENDDLFYVVLAMGKRHFELYKIPADSFGPVGEALLWTLEKGLGEAFTPTVKRAWAEIYGALMATMRLSARSNIDINRGLVA